MPAGLATAKLSSRPAHSSWLTPVVSAWAEPDLRPRWIFSSCFSQAPVQPQRSAPTRLSPPFPPVREASRLSAQRSPWQRGDALQGRGRSVGWGAGRGRGRGCTSPWLLFPAWNPKSAALESCSVQPRKLENPQDTPVRGMPVLESKPEKSRLPSGNDLVWETSAFSFASGKTWGGREEGEDYPRNANLKCSTFFQKCQPLSSSTVGVSDCSAIWQARSFSSRPEKMIIIAPTFIPFKRNKKNKKEWGKKTKHGPYLSTQPHLVAT